MKKLAIIIPCYNEAKRLNFKELESFAIKSKNTHLFFANDGSTDETLELIEKFSSGFENMSSMDFGLNQGKAETVRKASLKVLEESDFDLIGYWDADLATPLNEIDNFLREIGTRENLKVILGTRILRLGAQIERKRYRHYLGRVFATIVSMMLKLPVYDTQCGAKIFEASLARKIFQERFVTKWFFDVELFFRAIDPSIGNIDKKSFYELPLEKWKDVAGSKLKVTDFIKTPLELFKIYKKYYNA